MLESAIVEVDVCGVAGEESQLAKASWAVAVEVVDAGRVPRIAARSLGGASAGRTGESMFMGFSG